MDHVSLLTALCAGLAVIVAVTSALLMQLDTRVRKLERILRANVPEYERIGNTTNLHRVRLGWRVRAVMWWVGKREKIARWIEP